MSGSGSGCPHPVVYHGLCASCGADLSKPAATPGLQAWRKGGAEGNRAAEDAAASASGSSAAASTPRPFARSEEAAESARRSSQAIVLGGAHKTIHLSADALRDTLRRNTLELLRSRKLLCVLDLDHTLLHATHDPRIAPFVGREEDLFAFSLPIHYPPPPPGVKRPPMPPQMPQTKTHFVKLRPGLASFLEAAERVSDMHVYTMGARQYADAVVPLLDPTHRFIKHRVVSRDETGASTLDHGGSAAAVAVAVAKSLKRMHPCDEGLICIVDDREDVWRENKRNVVRAYEFLYFSGRGGEMNARPLTAQEAARLPKGAPRQMNGGAIMGPILPPIRSKSTALTAAATPATAPAAASAVAATPSPPASAKLPSPVAAAAALSAHTPTANAASAADSSSSKIRRRKTATAAPVPAPEMAAPTHALYQRRPAPAPAPSAASIAAASAASAASPIVLDGDDEKDTTVSKAAAASSSASASASGVGSAATPMDLIDDDEDAETKAMRELDAAIDLTDEQHQSIAEALPSQPAQTPSPYEGDPAMLPIHPYQFCNHPFPDNVLISLTAVLQAIHALFYEQTDRAVSEQLALIESSMIEAPTAATPQQALSELLPLAPFYSVPRLLGLIKRTTLAGCVIVFSGVFPTVKRDANTGGAPARGTSGAQRAEAWVAATAFGATCLEEFPEVEQAQRAAAKAARKQAKHGSSDADAMVDDDEDEEEDAPIVPFGRTGVIPLSDPGSSSAIDAAAPPPPLLRVTHVVAARDGSAKIHHANSLPLDKRPKLVHVSWLWHSIAHFQKGDEAKFPLYPEKPAQHANHTTTPAAVNPVDATKLAPAENVASSESKATISLVEPVNPPVAAAAADSSATPAAPASEAPIKRKIRKLPGATSPSVVAPASVTTSPPTAPTAATASSASPAASTPAAAAPASAVAHAEPAVAAAAHAAPAPVAPHGFHLVHHSTTPPTCESLVERVHAHLAAEATEASRRRALEELTQQQEKSKAARLAAALQARSPKANRNGAAAFPSSSSAAASHSSVAAAAAAPSSARAKKSVSFSTLELGPTNPRSPFDSVHTDADRAASAAAAAAAARPGSALLKRKLHLPLDDVDRAEAKKKERRAESKSACSAAAAAIDLTDVAAHDSDVRRGHSALDDADDLEISADDLYAAPDATAGEDNADAAWDEVNEDLFADDAGDGEGDYGDSGNFDDDM